MNVYRFSDGLVKATVKISWVVCTSSSEEHKNPSLLEWRRPKNDKYFVELAKGGMDR